MNQPHDAPRWRPMAAADLEAVSALANRIHTHHPERRDVLAAKLRLFPEGCFVLAREASEIGGYCFSHPWTRIVPPALDTVLEALPARPTAYFIHDLTVSSRWRGRGHASAVLPMLFAASQAMALDRIGLIAVNGSDPFWRRAGFERTPDNALQVHVRTKYGAESVHMTRMLDDAG